jgi:release factor glutamine methyltransferase
MTYTHLYQELVRDVSRHLQSLPDKPEETPDGVVHALWHLAAGVGMSIQLASESALPALDDSAIARLRGFVAQRIAGVPLAHLTGRQRFMGLDLHVGAESLIPRKETELLGRAALVALRKLASRMNPVTVIDVCTGCGNLAVALAHHVSQAHVFASDLSTEAVELARQNVRNLGLDQRVEVREGDLLAPFDTGPFDENVDLITCNPPYISSGKLETMPAEIIRHEPRMAFDGGPFGISILNRFIQEAPRFLRAGGSIAFEVGVGQGPAMVRKLAQDDRFRDVAPIMDETGNIRGVVASR